MNRWQDSLTDYIPVIAFMGTMDMLRVVLTPELEKMLGRKLTDWDWQYYMREFSQRVRVESWQEIIRWRFQRLADMKTIHDFVWEEKKPSNY